MKRASKTHPKVNVNRNDKAGYGFMDIAHSTLDALSGAQVDALDVHHLWSFNPDLGDLQIVGVRDGD